MSIPFTEDIQKTILNEAFKLSKENWKLPYAGCARSVAEIYFRAGLYGHNNREITLTYPDKFTLWGQSVAIPKPVPGCMIFFDKTYDAVGPSGVGPEDTFTHVGLVEKVYADGNILFWHYRSSVGWVQNTTAEVSQWYNASGSHWGIRKDWRIPIGYTTELGDKDDNGYDVIKVFVNSIEKDGSYKASIIKNGKPVKGFFELKIKTQED